MTDTNIEAIYRLSPLQEGILFHTLEAPGSDVYFQQYSCLLDELKDSNRWEQVWHRVAQRHAVMRTLFTWDKRDHPLQIVRERVAMPWEYLDWRDRNVEEQRALWASLQLRDRSRGFDLSTAPLMRFTLARVGQSCYHFMWSFHHILLDGWSQRLIFNQVLDAYRKADIAPAKSDQALPQYGEFIRWLDSVDLDAARLFWRTRLGGFSQATYIAHRVSTNSFSKKNDRREVRELNLASGLIERLSRVAGEMQVTLNTLVVAAWALILAAHTRASDVVFGSTVSGRPVDLQGAEGIAGLMINTLPLRVQISVDEPLAMWLKHLQSSQLDMRDYEQTPLVEIQRCSDLSAGSALFDSIVVFENIPGGVMGSPANAYPAVAGQTYTEYSHYPLALLVDPSEQMKLIAVYQPERVGVDRAGRLLEQLMTTMDSMSRSCDSFVGDIEVLPHPELMKITQEWNKPETEFPSDLCLHELFEQNAARVPGATALICGEKILSFAALNTAVNQLARYLRARGVGAGSLVPVFLERGCGAIVSFLAVLKTGAAYIPMDSGFPQERISQILDDITGAAQVLITQPGLVASLPATAYEVILPEQLEQEISGQAVGNLDLPVSAGHLAYVIYTSGSTGRPKGVMIEHSSLVNSTWARMHYYPEQPGVFLLMSSLAVDSSVAGLYWCLCSGAPLLVATPSLELDVERVGKLIAGADVSHLLCIASLYQLILEHCPAQQLRSLKTVIVAGEACAGSVIAAHQALIPAAQLYNEYGPSECTVWATVAKLSQWEAGQAVPIGRPIANTSLYIMDGRRRSVPIGVPGELYIGGAGLSRGYLNRPEATQAAFVEVVDPALIGGESRRLYKTGDLVRYLEDGNVEFLGRVDNQIKLRGYRIEPEEIEQVLGKHTSVAEVVVYSDRGPEADDQTRLILARLAQMDEDVVRALLIEAASPATEAPTRRGENQGS